MRPPGITCVTKAPPNDPGTLCRGRVTSPSERQGNTPSSQSAYQLVFKFDHRIAAARSLEELYQVSLELAEARKKLELSGVIRKPEAGDKEVKDAVREAITDQMGALKKIIVDGVWAVVDNDDRDLDAGVAEAMKTAFWETVQAILENTKGDFAKDVEEAIRERKFKDIAKAGAEAVESIAKSFGDKEGVIRKALQVMRSKGIFIDKQMEGKIRRLAGKKLASLSGSLSALAKFFASPVFIFVKLLLISNTVMDDAGEIYEAFDTLQERITDRHNELLPELPTAPGPELKLR
jgi:hypothetical protein